MDDKINPDHEKGRFKNPWKPWPVNFFTGSLKFSKWLVDLKTKTFQKVDYDIELPVYKPKIYDNSDSVKKYLRATWLGHASVLLEIDGYRILCDPMFSNRCPSYVGPKRYRPCPVKDIPPNLDAIVISHNHYDHMDSYTITNISNKYKDNKLKWFIPVGDRKYLEGMVDKKHYPNITEMKWWQEETLKKDGVSNLKVIFTPTQHWSNRGILDYFKSLWGSYCFKGATKSFWFGGDTGYCPVFEKIGNLYGPFDGAAIPIGAYEPRSLMEFQHVNPEEAVKIHKDIRSKVSFGIHWGTFTLTEEEHLAPRTTLKQLVEQHENMETNTKLQFTTINHGESIIFDRDGEYTTERGILLDDPY